MRMKKRTERGDVAVGDTNKMEEEGEESRIGSMT
jgi:hypothetical protein